MNRRKGDGSKWIRRTAQSMMLAAMVCGTLTVGACSKKQAPVEEAPPPPPPPPPAPVMVSFDTISQELQADPRVQFAADLSVTDAEVAKAVIKLADAIARGDAGKLRGLVNAETKKVVSDLENAGVWGEQMAGIEAVRVVYAAAYDSSANKITLETALKVLEAKTPEEMPEGISPALAAQIGSIVGGALGMGLGIDPNSPPDADAIKKMIEKASATDQTENLRKFMDDESFAGARSLLEAALNNASAASGLPTGKYLVLLAVQDKDGAELSGWGVEEAFGGLEFNVGNTVKTTKPRAIGFDGVGLAGFGSGTPALALAGAESSSGKPAAEKTETPAEGTKKDEEPDPSKKRTPAGPITIPGG